MILGQGRSYGVLGEYWVGVNFSTFSYHPAVRRWAEETLTQVGYDPVRMLIAWGIFWRRKGWH